MEGFTETKCRAETDGKAIQKLPPMGIHPIYSHQIQTLFLDANKCLLTGAWYSCLLRSSTSAWQIKRWMLSANHWTEDRVTNRGTRVRTHGAKGVCSPTGGTTIWTNQYPQSSQGLKHQPKSTRGSRCICSRWQPCRHQWGRPLVL